MQFFEVKDALFRLFPGLPEDRPVIAAVSGGPDSMALLDSLQRAGIRLVAAHFNHGLRPEAGQDAELVAQYCALKGIPLRIGRGDVAAYAGSEHLSVEEAARILRYRFLFEVARIERGAAVVTGHTADDQVETVLMHIVRGSGMHGLAGMQACATHTEWDAEIPLVRPLLKFWRADTEAYCRDESLAVALDASNSQTIYTRNRIRLELIPMLQSFNPEVKERIFSLAQIVEGDLETLDEVVRAACQTCNAQVLSQSATLSHAELKALPAPLRRNVLYKILRSVVAAEKSIDSSLIERLDDFVQTPSRSRMLQPGAGLAARIQYGRLVIEREDKPAVDGRLPAVDGNQDAVLLIPGAVKLQNGQRIEAEFVDEIPEKWVECPTECYLDADRLEAQLAVRARLNGDRYRPFGMGGREMKVSDWMINEKIPQQARAGWPLVLSGAEIIWAPYFRPSETARVSETTTRVVRLIWR